MVSRGLPGGLWCPSPPFPGQSSRCNVWKTPLGRYLFTSSELTRDFIEIGLDAELWGRRSRLRLSGKPLILTELFLRHHRCTKRRKNGVEPDAE